MNRRKARQHKKKLFMMIREDLQLSGDLPTVPGGGLKSEVVPPETQQEGGLAELPKLVTKAAREGWATPEDSKKKHVDTLSDIIDDPEQSAKVKIAAFNALRLADKDQWERRNPEEAGKTKGGVSINNTVKNTVAVGELFSDINTIEQRVARVLETDTNSEAVGSIRADSNAKPLDEEEPNITETESEAD